MDTMNLTKWVNELQGQIDVLKIKLQSLDLNDMPDVHVTEPAAGQALIYDGESEQFTNQDIEFDLEDLTDVLITEPTDGQALIYDATNQKYINGDVASDSYSETTLYTGDKTVSTGEVTLSDNLSNYDQLIIWVGYTQANIGALTPFNVDVTSFKTMCPYDSGSTTTSSGHMILCAYQTQYIRVKCGSADNKLLLFDAASITVMKVVGVKY